MSAEHEPTMQEVTKRPWCRGPLELLKHANGHLIDGGDTDRRIALIGFDNTIEVCIEVFLRLHPRMRNDLQLKREEVEAALRNYHSKLEFFDKHVQAIGGAMNVPIEAVLWYHSLRNELYHSGNGMVPELHVMDGAKQAAIEVFSALFGFDPTPLLRARPSSDTGTDEASVTEYSSDLTEHRRQDRRTAPLDSPQARSMLTLPYSSDPRSEFLRVYVDFERVLAQVLGAEDGRDRRVLTMWQRVQERYGAKLGLPGDETDGYVARAVKLRNAMMHSEPLSPSLAAAGEDGAERYINDVTSMLELITLDMLEAVGRG